jgi:hypothetical protein
MPICCRLVLRLYNADLLPIQSDVADSLWLYENRELPFPVQGRQGRPLLAVLAKRKKTMDASHSTTCIPDEILLHDLREKLLEFGNSDLKNLEDDVKSVILLDHLAIYQNPYKIGTYPRIKIHPYINGMYPGKDINDCEIFISKTEKWVLLDEVRHFNTYVHQM